VTGRIRLGMVGCGAVCDWHLSGIEQSGAPFEITAAVDIDAARARRVADRTGAVPYTSMTHAIESSAVDAVDIMLPHHLHEEFAVEALSEGVHVLLEKPMAPTLDACDRILASAENSSTVFMVAENAQYWPEVVEAVRLVEEGLIGDLVTARASIAFPPMPDFYGGENPWRLDRAAAGGGIAIDAGSHWLRPLRMFCGEVDSVVAALGHPFPGMQGESLVRALLRFRTGVVASFDAILTEAPVGLDVFFRVTGTRGELTVDASGAVTVFDAEHRDGAVIHRGSGYMASYAAEVADFASAVLDGRPPAADAAYSVGELATALAMYRSAESGRWEKVHLEEG